MPLIFFISTPLGRIVGAAILGIALLLGVYMKIRADIRADVEGKAAINTMERVNEAIRAGDAARTDPERMRELDEKYCRDCR